MARQSLDPNSPYYAVGRTADRDGLRVQFRAAYGGAVVIHRYRSGDKYKENYNFVKLEITRYYGSLTLALGYASPNGQDETWEPLGPPIYFPVPLTLKGIAVSSHSAGRYSTFDFINLRKQLPGAAPALVNLHALQTAKVGHSEEPLVIRLTPSGVRSGCRYRDFWR
jgi:hypothetical protein